MVLTNIQQLFTFVAVTFAMLGDKYVRNVHLYIKGIFYLILNNLKEITS